MSDACFITLIATLRSGDRSIQTNTNPWPAVNCSWHKAYREGSAKGNIVPTLDRYPQLDCIVRSDQILFCAEISFGRLHRSVTQQKLNLLKLTAAGPA